MVAPDTAIFHGPASADGPNCLIQSIGNNRF
jgi:hypothetical protein